MFEQVKKKNENQKNFHLDNICGKCRVDKNFFDGYDQWFIFGRQIGES